MPVHHSGFADFVSFFPALSPTSPAKGFAAELPRWMVVLCALLWIAVGLFGRQPYKPDEAYTVGLVKSIADSGDWVVPQLVGEPFMEKPPLFFGVAALFARAIPWLPLHEAARFAVVLFDCLGLLAIAACARCIYGAGSGRIAVALTLATIGAIGPLHQLITDTALFAGVSIALLGIVRAPQRPDLGGVFLGAGLAISFLSKGLLGPGLILCTAMALLAFTPWRLPAIGRTTALAALIAVPASIVWLAALALRSPHDFYVWFFDNNMGRFFDLNHLGPKKDFLFYARTLLWYGFPCWPLALWGLARHVGGRTDAEQWLRELPPVAFFASAAATLTLASDGRALYALVLVPPLAVMATGGVLRLSLAVERVFAICVAAVFVMLSLALVGGWGVAMQAPQLTSALPAIAAMPSMVAPSAARMATYGLVALPLLFMLAVSRQSRRGALPLAGAAGLALLWASLMLPWGSYLDTLKGYRTLALDLGQHLPEGNCVASQGLGEGERALLDYFIGLRTRRVESGASTDGCTALLVQSLSDSKVRVDSSWLLLWEGARGGLAFDTSVFRLYGK